MNTRLAVAVAVAEHFSTGEVAVTAATIVLTLATVAAVAVTYYLTKVSRQLVEVTREDAQMIAKANELALREMGDTTTAALDSNADVAIAALHSHQEN